MTRLLHLVLTLLLVTTSPPAAAGLWGNDPDELLPPDEAFRFSAEVVDGRNVRATWDIADGYYLYRNHIRLWSDTPGVELGEIQLPPGKKKQDEFFGEVETYRGRVTVEVPVTRSEGADRELTLMARSQGCADIGVCYPPHTQTALLMLPEAAAAPETGAPPGPDDGLADLGQSLSLGLDDDQEFLPPDEAFRLSTEVTGPNTIVARWDIAPDYYMYRDKFAFELVEGEGISLGQAELPPGEVKQDEFFGRVEVYHDRVEARLPVARTRAEAASVTLRLTYQGCAEAGICYPPQKKLVELALPAAALAGPLPGAPADAAPADAAPPTPATTAAPVTEQDRLAQRLATGNALLTMLAFFGFGLLLAFTPCVLPMVPILSGIIIGQGEDITTRRAFVLSLVYVLAMALTYTGAGVIAGLTGENLQAAFQNPWVLGSFAAVFVLLSLSMFGFYDLQMPAAIQSRLNELSNRQAGGTLAGVAIMGFLSALIVGPCVAAPLAGALIYIGQTGDPWLGGGALFALSMGMGTPLLAIGTGAGKLLPRAGGWMNAVKAVFGVLLLAVAIWMLERILPAAIGMLLWAALLIISAVYLGALENLEPEATGWRKFWKGVGLILLGWGALLLVGVAAGGRDVYQPLRDVAFTGAPGAAAPATRAAGIEFRRIKTVEDLERAVAEASAQGKGVMLDFFAEWCTDCHRMEKVTFRDPQVLAALENVVALKADVTANDAEDKRLLKHFRLIGPPTIIFFGPDGKERTSHRVMGFMGPEEFAAHVRAAVGGKA